MRPSLTPFLLAAALLLSGCVVEEVPETQAASDDPAPAASDPPRQEPTQDEAPADDAPAPAPHGEPQVTEGPIESGTQLQQIPGAWARRTVTITNDANGAGLMALNAAVAAGSIRILAQERDGYIVEAVIESRALTEADARAQVERAHLVHDDTLDGTTLRLGDRVDVDPIATTPAPLPPGVLETGLDEATLAVHLTITVPVGPAVEAVAHSASGDLSVEDIVGPLVELSTASGDVALAALMVSEAYVSSASGDIALDGLTGSTLSAGTSSGDVTATGLAVRSVAVSTSSGDVGLAGTIDDLEVGTSSGDVDVDATPAASGAYGISSASGDVTLQLGQDDGQAYHVAAGTASGDIVIDLPGGEVIEDEERRKEVASAGFDDADLQTSVDVGTSSGDITVTA